MLSSIFPCKGNALLIAPHLWPLLDAFQDPTSSPALLAFHLHRLHATGTALTRTGLVKSRDEATLITQARINLSAQEITALATALAVPTSELTRDLTFAEQREWLFYRVSAENRLIVWHRAQQIWQSHGLSQRAAAGIMGYSPSHVSRALQHNPRQRQKVLAYAPTARLTQYIGLTEGPEKLIEDLRPER